jgi:hypothetical protein
MLSVRTSAVVRGGVHDVLKVITPKPIAPSVYFINVLIVANTSNSLVQTSFDAPWKIANGNMRVIIRRACMCAQPMGARFVSFTLAAPDAQDVIHFTDSMDNKDVCGFLSCCPKIRSFVEEAFIIAETAGKKSGRLCNPFACWPSMPIWRFPQRLWKC